jgi:hypothetical protein
MRAPFPHEMVHDGTDTTGMEEWHCPVCGRHFIMRWPPDYERLVLAEGENVTHIGTKGEVGFRSGRVIRAADELGDEEAWRRWLREEGIDWDGSSA